MYLIAIAWMYVVIMMALAEALSAQGTVLGALFTLLLYGCLPVALVMYLLGTPMRRRTRRAAEAAEANFAPNSPNEANCAEDSMSPKVAASQNAVEPPLPSTTS